MQIFDHIHNGDLTLTLKKGEQEHYVLLDPENVRLHVIQEEGSSFLLHLIHLSDANSRQEIIVEQQGIGCDTRLYGLGLLKGKQLIDTTTRVSHAYHNPGSKTEGGKSDQLFKYIADDESTASFYGELKVMPDAQRTDAHQTNRNILLSRTAKIMTKPQLEIYADDVKCSHGASTGQLDANALFYMQQRGVSLHSAKRLLLAAFLSDVLTGLPDDMQDTLRDRIDQRL